MSRYLRPVRAGALLNRHKRDVVIVGGGHNGLVAAGYLARKGLDVLVLERSSVVGGAAVTSEIVPGFKFSRASYLAGLLRPSIIRDLELEKHGFKYLPRNPSSFTPCRADGPDAGKYLMFWDDAAATHASIAQFSRADADCFEEYEAFLSAFREVMQPLLDGPPPQGPRNLREAVDAAVQLGGLSKALLRHRDQAASFYELFTGPATQILNRWFEGDVLKATLATDAVIGSMAAPSDPGSAYVLLHHVMGEAAGKKGVWAYVEGGMGAITQALAASAHESGATIATDCVVEEIVHDGHRATGVKVALDSGTETILASTVLANCNPHHTFTELLKDAPLPPSFKRHVEHVDYGCGAFKINCAVSELPNFLALPSSPDGAPGPQHRGTIHFENHISEIEEAAAEAKQGRPATRPVVEMTIPSALDTTIAPKGKHVVQLFVQYAPYDVDPKVGTWSDPAFKEAFVKRVFGIVDEFAPNFSASVLGYDALSPLDLERIFGLYKGNIFHGALGLHQLGYTRPAPGFSDYRSPLPGLYLCGSGTHPGGGVMGAPGRNCARAVLQDKGLGGLPKN